MLKQIGITIAQCMWFYLPAAAANIAPVLCTSLKWNTPIWEKGLGPNKTWRGLLAGILLATLTVLLQESLSTQEGIRELSTLPYQKYNPLWLGILFGGGALIGDAVKSYFKRLQSIPSGEKWWPFDQLDFIVGSTLFMSIVYIPRGDMILTALVLAMFLHPLINQIGYRLKLKKVPW